MRSLKRLFWNQWVGTLALYIGGMALLVCLTVAICDRRNPLTLLPDALLTVCKMVGILALLIGGKLTALALGCLAISCAVSLLRRVPRLHRLSDQDRLLLALCVFSAIVFFYLIWPTPYIRGVRELPQRGADGGSLTAKYEVQINRFTGTLWAKTMGGWERFEGRAMYESQLGHDLRYPDDAAAREEYERERDEGREEMRY
jgi:hypothetical protein